MKTARPLLQLIFVIAAAVFFPGCGKPKQQLNVYIWPNYLSPEIVSGFEKQFDCKVIVDTYDDNESMVAKVSATGGALYDVISPSTFVIPAMIERGLLAPLRREKLSNFTNLNPDLLGTKFDPNNQYTVPLAWGTTGILIRSRSKEPVEETWGLFLDPGKQPGPFVLMDDSRAWISTALIYKGYQNNSTNSIELAEVRDILQQTKRRSLGFVSPSASISRLMSKEAQMTMAMNMDAARAIDEDPELRYFFPREGGGKWMDNLAIPARAANRDLAEKFINYLLSAEVAAAFAEYSMTATPNKAAMEYINPKIRTNAIIYPPGPVVNQLLYAKDLGEAQKLYDELWTQIKAK